MSGNEETSTSMIDRRALVQRHNPVRTTSNPTSPMQVGNGCFAFGTDITGLQTFMPFSTMSEWGWKNDKLPAGYSQESVQGARESHTAPDNEPELTHWLRSNPNRMNLGRIGLCFADSQISEEDLSDCAQRLDLWTGTIHSTMKMKGADIIVDTVSHPTRDAIGVVIESSLLSPSELSIFFDFPFNEGRTKFSAPYVGVWDQSSDHSTEIVESGDIQTVLLRQVDDAKYFVGVQWSQSGKLEWQSGHRFVLRLSGSCVRLDVTVTFSQQKLDVPSPQSIFQASKNYWPSFWQSGGAIDLSQSTDTRWGEVERRLVLSQYASAVNAVGHDPPQESGLVNLGWFGKFHMEMNWWHSAHLALFNRWSLLERSLSIYDRFLPSAKRLATAQGYKGARWPKMADPSGNTSPGEINSLLIWQQPHPILFAELDYRAHPSKQTLYKWKAVIEASADFMASFPRKSVQSSVYCLGPQLHLMSENTDSNETYNPSFELHYWRIGLSIAEEWWDRLGLEPKAEWSTVRHNLAPLPTENGVYIMWQEIKDMWTNYNWEHPALIAMYGWLPGHNLDHEIMLRTSKEVWDIWRLDRCWGWDFGMLAMNAARSGFPEKAIEFLLDENYKFDDVGMVLGTDQVPSPYFPGMGSFLYACAFMAAGWDGASSLHAPGFPAEGWDVKYEGLSKAL
ncbi:hypothetical protein V500_11545 [Pseudogymnoascus sp. VKM F-4518 (FW-2643)]|nr:hypothetical protein V500_11545 [Pseudogymnoascus sp. VKM F-4518 (FW-2643)]